MVEYNLLIEFGITIFWLVIFTFLAHIIYSNKKDDKDYKYYLTHYYWVLITSFGFAIIYTQILAGDTTGYWKGAVALNDLLIKEPGNYLYEMITTENFDQIPKYIINKDTAFFGRHYLESESWFVSKVFNLFSFFCFGSYFSLTLWVGTFSGWISWRFYLFIRKYTQIESSLLTFTLLFIPSVGFWCHSISKDTLVYIGILISIRGLIALFDSTQRKLIKTWIYVVVGCYIIFNTRSFVIISILFGIFVAFTVEFNKNKSQLTRLLTRTFGISIILTSLALYITKSDQFGELSNEALLDNAKVIQQDFLLNTSYDGDRYDLGITDYSLIGILKSFPVSVTAALFRPFLWDGVNGMLLINSVESSVIVIFALWQILKFIKTKEKIKLSNKNKILLLVLISIILVMSFFVGFVSGLFGVLVRMRAPLLPLLLLAILIFVSRKKLNEYEKH